MTRETELGPRLGLYGVGIFEHGEWGLSWDGQLHDEDTGRKELARCKRSGWDCKLFQMCEVPDA